MNSSLKISMTAVVAAFTFAGVARAEDAVRIDLVGKSPTIVQAEIVKAAYKVCRNSGTLPAYSISAERECVSDTIEKANADFRRISAAPSDMTLAQTAREAGQR